MEFQSWRTMDPEMTAAAVVAVATLLLLAWISNSRRLRNLPPGPRGMPILGSILQMGALPHVSFFELAKRYGPVMFLKMGVMPTLVVSDAEAAKVVLQTSDQIFASRPRLTIPAVLSYDQQDLAFAPYGPHWRKLRKICNSELLAVSKLNRFSNLIKQEIVTTIQTILRDAESSKPLNVTKMLTGMSSNVMTQMMWNQRHFNLQCGGPNKFEEIFDKIVVISGSNNLADFLPDFLPSIASLMIKFVDFESRGRKAHLELDSFFEDRIRERVAKRASGGRAEAGEEDFLDALLNAMDESKTSQGISRNTLKGALTDMLMAGRDTSAASIEWCMAELMRHPNVMKRAQDELMTVVGKDRMVSASDLPNLKYINAVVKETLRRRNPAPMTPPHFSTADCKVKGYTVPAHTTVFVNLYALHHDAAFWKDPFLFNPDRFLNSDIDIGGRHFNFLPFGSGRRMCVGMNLASGIMHQAVAQLLHCIDWSLPEGETPESLDMTEVSSIFLGRKEPLQLIAKPRLSSLAYANMSC